MEKNNIEEIVYIGIICWFNNAKGYGFISKEDGNGDIFVHWSNVNISGYKTLKANQKVTFTLGLNNSGKPKACNVTIINE